MDPNKLVQKFLPKQIDVDKVPNIIGKFWKEHIYLWL